MEKQSNEETKRGTTTQLMSKRIHVETNVLQILENNTSYSRTCKNFVAAHLFPLVTGQAPTRKRHKSSCEYLFTSNDWWSDVAKKKRKGCVEENYTM